MGSRPTQPHRLLPLAVALHVLLLVLSACNGDSADSPTPTCSPTASLRLPTSPTPTPSIKCADVNGDGVVTVKDILKIVLRFGARSGGARYQPKYDLNNDGVINLIDVMLAIDQLGTRCRQG